MDRCYICQHSSVTTLLDFSHQPVSNRFLSDQTAREDTHPFCFGQCQYCGLLQLINPISSQQTKSRYPWLTYNEPENHLDALTETIINLPGIEQNSIFCGISGHETSLLTRLNKRGFANTWQLNLKQDLNIEDPLAGVETIQQEFTAAKIPHILKNRPQPKVIIARAILEHAHHPLNFIQTLQKLVQPDGYIIFEVPDITPSLELCHYAALWEEHILYFTPFSLMNSLKIAGLELTSLAIYPSTIENVMIAITQINTKSKSNIVILQSSLMNEWRKAKSYTTTFPSRKKWYREILSSYRERHKIALLGAGHLACHFINLLELTDLIDFVIDDNPHKIGLYMPGSHLPILSSSALETYQAKLCLMSLNPESEKKVVNKNQKYLANGGRFLSIFSSSEYALT